MRRFTLNIRGEIREYHRPLVMGILNATPESFYSGSRTLNDSSREHISDCTDRMDALIADMLAQGVDIIDVGGCSTRPGALPPTPEAEMERVRLAMERVRTASMDIPVSVDTFRADVARRAVEEWGADIINDISAGTLDSGMAPAVARLKVPYIIMHMRGVPSTMNTLTCYPDGVVAGVASELRERIVELNDMGIADIIVDPGFGFAKTAAQNYELLAHLPELEALLDHRPILVGLSRKSMIYRPLEITPAEALPGTIALNTLALERGAAILRVHDVAPARQTVDVYSFFRNEAGARDRILANHPNSSHI